MTPAPDGWPADCVVLWRLVWLGARSVCALQGAGRLGRAARSHPGWLLVILGTVTTLYTFLGGMQDGHLELP